MENEAQKKLKAWLDDGGRKVSWLAQKVRANRSTVHQWLNGKQKPNPNYRVAIEEITNGKVPASNWGNAMENVAMKKWTDEEDRYLVAYANVVGAHNVARDLAGRSESSVKARVKKLKDTGAWEAWEMVSLGHLYARILSGHQLKSSADHIQSELAQMHILGWDIPAGWLHQ